MTEKVLIREYGKYVRIIKEAKSVIIIWGDIIRKAADNQQVSTIHHLSHLATNSFITWDKSIQLLKFNIDRSKYVFNIILFKGCKFRTIFGHFLKKWKLTKKVSGL